MLGGSGGERVGMNEDERTVQELFDVPGRGHLGSAMGRALAEAGA